MPGEVEEVENAVDHAALLDAAADAVVVYRGDQFRYVNDALCELTGYDRSALRRMPASDLLHPGDRERLRDYQSHRYEPGEREGTDPPTRFDARVITRDDDVRTCEFRVRVVPLDDGQATLAIVRDVTDRARRETELEHRRDELTSLAGLNDLLSSVTRAIVRTPTREAVEQTVCDRFTGDGRYRCAWIWDLDVETPRAASGIDEGTVRELRDGEGPVGDGDGPGARATRDVEVRVERGVAPPVGEGSEGTLGAVPLGNGNVVHGVLVAYADRLDAFGVDDRAALAVFGETVGFVLTAIENRDLLVANAATELVCHVDDDRSPLVRIARHLGCRVDLRGYVPAGPETQLWYARVADPAVDAESLADDDAIESARTVSTDADRCLLELAVTGDSFARTAIDCGARVASGRSTGDGIRFAVEVAGQTPTRDVVRRLTAAYPSTKVVAKSAQDRRVRSEAELRGTLRERLTEHQWIALRTAYLAGYFEWPRDSTGEMVADTLGVTSPTFHHHLRNGHRRLLDVIFDEATTASPRER